MENNKKQTAVEWLQESMLLSHEQQMQFEGLFQQAKAMEKEQILKTWEDGFMSTADYGEQQKRQ